MLKETEETICYVVRIYIIGGISNEGRAAAPGYADGAERVDEIVIILFTKLPPVYHTRLRLHTVTLIVERQARKL